MFVYLIWVKILQKVDFGEIKCGKISDVISEFMIQSEILPHLISPKSTFCKIFSSIFYLQKKFSGLKKINAMNREIEIGNVGIGKNRISDTCP